MSILCIVTGIPGALLLIAIGWASLTLLFESIYDLASGFAVEEDVVGGIFGLLFCMIIWHVWTGPLGCFV